MKGIYIYTKSAKAYAMMRSLKERLRSAKKK